MDSVFVETVIPTRFGRNNIIACRRLEIIKQIYTLSERLAKDTENVIDEHSPVLNVMYALRFLGSNKWQRATVKFVRRHDNVPVLQLIDEAGVLDFDQTKMQIRKIQCPIIRDLEFGEIKMFIYAIGTYQNDYEFQLIFDQLIKGKDVTAVISLLERKANHVHECYVGDIFYRFNGRYHSFREVLIKEKISYPSRVQGSLNRSILRARAEWLAIHNGRNSVIAVRNSVEPNNPIEVINGRFDIHDFLGEGSVTFSFL